MALPKTLTLAHKGIAKTAIVLPQGVAENLRQAAADLQATLEKIIGMAPPIQPDDGQPAPRGNSALHIGATACAESLGLNAGDAGVEGFCTPGHGNSTHPCGRVPH